MNNGINLIALFNLDRLIGSFNMKYKKRSDIIVTVFITFLGVFYSFYGVSIIIFKIQISKLGGIKFFSECMFSFYLYIGLLIMTTLKGSKVNSIDRQFKQTVVNLQRIILFLMKLMQNSQVQKYLFLQTVDVDLQRVLLSVIYWFQLE